MKKEKGKTKETRIIAAAPELYNLLKETVDHIDEWNFPIDLGDRIQKVLKKIEEK